jgi:hypothetical protein
VLDGKFEWLEAGIIGCEEMAQSVARALAEGG